MRRPVIVKGRDIHPVTAEDAGQRRQRAGAVGHKDRRPAEVVVLVA
ncbi:hypothetical protein ACP3TJ_04975 [Desulforudis sp. 1088]